MQYAYPVKTLSARVEEETYDKVAEFAEKRDISHSRAVRIIVQRGLEAETDPTVLRVRHLVAIAGFVFFFGAFGELSADPTVGVIGGAVFATVTLYDVARQRGLVDRARDRLDLGRGDPS
jgi:hypothetical protein